MYGTVRRNLGKRKLAEPWLHQTSTAYRPGEQSIVRGDADGLAQGRAVCLGLRDHREAKGKIDIDERDHTLRQLKQVYGAAVGLDGP